MPRVLILNGQRFYFLPSGDGVQIYRIDGNQFRLAASSAGIAPPPTAQREAKQLGQWTWHDSSGTGEPRPDEINWFKKPGEGHYGCFGMDVDDQGNIVFADTPRTAFARSPWARSMPAATRPTTGKRQRTLSQGTNRR